MLLWILLARDNPHDLSNAKQMAYKTDFIVKTDLNAAYHKIHKNSTTVSTCIEIADKLAFLCLVLPFGTTPAPA